MAGIIEDVAYLSQEIGPRPAGTEEEQQTALYLAEKMQREAGFSTIIEDFQCIVNPHIVRIVCFALALVAVVLPLVLPIASIPCLIVGILAAAVCFLELAQKPVISRFIRSGVSQNVVAKYQPGGAAGTSRRRKVILVANYDSGRVLREEKAPLKAVLPLIQKATAVALVAAPVLLLIKTVFLAGDTGVLSSIFVVLFVICAVLFVLPLLRAILFAVAPYSQSANNNASGVSVLVEVARMVGQGLVSSEELADRASRERSVVHGEAAAREAGVVPEGAELEYEATETPLSAQESLAAAKAAIAALTGKPVADKVPVTDISSRLVKGGGLTPEDESVTSVHFEVGETPRSKGPSRINVSAPFDDQESVVVDNASSEEPSRANVRSGIATPERLQEAAPQSPVAQIAAADAARAAAEEAQAAAHFERSTPQALQQGMTGAAVRIDKTPAWARSAQAKARANKPEASQSHTVSRSQYADTVAAQLLERPTTREAVDVRAASAENLAVSEADESHVQSEPPQTPEQAALSARLEALRSEIQAAPVPHVSEETLAAFERMDASDDEVNQTAHESEIAHAETAADRTAPHEVHSSDTPVVDASHSVEVDSQGLDRPSVEMPATPSQPLSGSEQESKRLSKKDGAAFSSSSSPAATTAMAPIDVSAFLDKEASESSSQSQQTSAVTSSGPISQSASPYGERTADGPSPVFADAATQRVSSEKIQEAIHEAAASDVIVPKREATDEVEESAQPIVSPIVGMEALLPSISAPMPEVDTATPTDEEVRRQVIVLPSVSATHTSSSDDAKQRAPMADVTEDTQAGTKALLSNMLPRIDDAALSSSPVLDREVGSSDADLPPLEGAVQPQAVSMTGSFSTVGGTGSFAPVGDELVADIDPEDRYIDDVDDSAYEEEYTETGAFAGPGYVDMPKSRAGRFFSRFRSKKKQPQQDAVSVREWVDVDEDYNARSVGQARGDWSSFRQDDVADVADNCLDEPGIIDYDSDAYTEDDGFIEVDYRETSLDNHRGWNGGAFSLSRMRQTLSRKSSEEEIPEHIENEEEYAQEAYLETSPAVRVDGDTEVAEQINLELKKLQDFRHPDINTEVWFVALGAELYTHSGMNAFLETHADELKGAIVVNLEALGAGDLSFVESEGILKRRKPSSRAKRFLRQASEISGVSFGSAALASRETPASIAMSRGIQGLTIAGMDGSNTALYATEDDVIDNLDEAMLADSARFVMAILKSV